MQITPGTVQKPAAPQVPKGAKELDVSFTGPVLRDEVIGQIPADGYSPLFTGSMGGSDDVVRPQPVLGADGKPQFATQVAHLDLRPYSAVKRALIGGAIGAGVMGVAGAVLGYFTGNLALGSILGAGAGAAGGAVIAAQQVRGDTTHADWELQPVIRHELNGYSHSAIPQTTTVQTGKNTSMTITTGYWHTYSPNVNKKEVGDQHFWAPIVKHSSDD